MKKLPNSLIIDYIQFIENRGIQSEKHPYYLKWFRFYLDFCSKYRHLPSEKDSLHLFIKKLEDKKQSEQLRKQARHSVELFWDMQAPIKSASVDGNPQNNGMLSPDISIMHNKKSLYKQPRADERRLFVGMSKSKEDRSAQLKIESNDWTGVYQELENAIKIRHYSIKTLKSYTHWTRKFQNYLKSKDPQLLDVADVKLFLTFLAVEEGVSASSQNLAFNSLLFLFRNVFGKEFGKVDGIVRAKRKPYIPVVLSRPEIDKIIENLNSPYNLIIKLMYGCGLRISECLSLRVQNFNFDMEILTIHDGKGKKDRTMSLPEVLMEDLQLQLDEVIRQHDADCNGGYDGVFLVNQLEKKYVNASKDLVWQWFFPAKELTHVSATKQNRRYHVHDTVLQKALRSAVRRSKIPKRVTSHTFRHSFASHLLQANYDIRTIQELMGHSDIKTTMIYTHTVKSTTKKEAKSPLDF